MKPRARSVYFSKFIVNSLGLSRSPNWRGRNIVIGRLIRLEATPRGHRRNKCRQWARAAEGAGGKFDKYKTAARRT
jgi:hypothetical protein